MNDNPYAPPKAESAFLRPRTVRSRIWWFVIPTIVGTFIGANVFAGALGTSPGDPFGTEVPSGIGGFVGLFVGALLHRFIRPQQYSTNDNTG